MRNGVPKFLASSADATNAGLPVGGKARALAELTANGFPVPDWFVVLPAAAEAKDFPAVLGAAMEELFPAAALLAVRSSAGDEDGAQHSFAGQLESFLDIPAAEAAARVADVWRSGAGERLAAYRRAHGLPAADTVPAVIVQRMVPAAAAGVAFGIDPVTGRRGTAVVSAVRGLGDQLVGGDTDAETWEVDRAGTVHAFHPGPAAVLTRTQAAAVAALARECGGHFGCPQDIEWAIDGAGKLWLLQARPVTGLDTLPEADGAFAIWDNANIAESYGGVTTPLTFSFARRVYEAVYRQFCRLLGVAEPKIAAHDGTFRRMLGLVRGRVYYHLLNWHRVLALLPGYRFNRAFMEGMMGVKEPLPPEAAAELAREQGPAPTRAARGWDALALGRATLGVIWSAWRLPRQTEAFYARLDEALREPAPALATWRADELAAYYHELERRLLRRWDAPLVNDFFAMIAFGSLRRLAAKWYGDADGNLANALLADTGGIVSVEPVRLLREMAQIAARTPELAATLRVESVPTIRGALTRQPELAGKCAAYLARFGNRCLEELKLETPTLHDNPLGLYRAVGQLAAAPASPATRPEPASPPAEPPALPGPWWKKALFRWVLRRARDRVRERENLRFARTRVFGRVRRIFVEIGRRLHAAGKLGEARDVFYLTVDEVLGFVDGTIVSTDLRGLVATRRAEFATYRQEPALPGRFVTRGAIHLGNAFAATAPMPTGSTAGPDADLRRGLACCAGTVRGRARVVLDPRNAEILSGEILVARRTDPGWVLLFPAAAGLAVEHGSLLSHAAIVARELKLPAVVSIPGLTDWLQTGDLIELDGATGSIRRLAAAS